jgi:hypothetical protein
MLSEITDFFARLDEIDCWVDGTGVANFPFQRTPSEFLEFAENDLKKMDPQATANSLANAKRAMDCQLDYFFETYGLSRISAKERWSTGKKISLMDDLGIVPQSILHKVNQARNDFEHRYELPSVVTAENSIDIVGLFIAATDLYLFPAKYGTYFEIRNETETPGEEPKSRKLSDLLKKPSADVHLDLLQNDAIGASATINGITIDHQVSSEKELYDYLYLLTFILHSNRINTPNSTKFFLKLKYAKPPSGPKG